ncbi:MAG: multidrug ABC transporter substrate-binding protein [Verrucomicrobia bacterium]|nr:MAG: multidrug ABC transporter substrate-binding protein [Verrucomicrobiota bacterium]
MSTMITLKAALRALNKNKMRSGLTALGIIIGVGAVIAMVGIGNGAKAQVEAQVASLGQNVIQVSAGSTSSRGVRQGADTAVTLTVADAEAIAEEIPDVLAVSPEVKIKTQIVTGNRNWSASVYGESADYFSIRQWPVDSGTTFTEQDVRAAAKVAVLGATAAEELFGDQEPLGEIVRIQNAPFTVIGVLKSKGTSVSGSDNDDNVIVPYTIAMKRLVGQQTNLRRINVQAANADVLSEVETQITELLRQRHRTGSGDESDFKVQSQLEIGEVATQTTRTMTLLLAAIASVSLVVGGIGIMNIMLVSVTERTREIGVRMAVGARGGDILRQFLGEALTLSSLGGLIGIAVGTGTSKLIAATQDWPTLISLDSVLIAFFFSAAVGIFFGFYPARKASRLDPIDSLRYE